MEAKEVFVIYLFAWFQTVYRVSQKEGYRNFESIMLCYLFVIKKKKKKREKKRKETLK